MSSAIPAIFAARASVMRAWFLGSYEMLPDSWSRSSPPIRCSSPGLPGRAQARASVWGSRRNGWNPSGSLLNFTGKLGKLSTSGITHGSAALAR